MLQLTVLFQEYYFHAELSFSILADEVYSLLIITNIIMHYFIIATTLHVPIIAISTQDYYLFNRLSLAGISFFYYYRFIFIYIPLKLISIYLLMYYFINDRISPLFFHRYSGPQLHSESSLYDFSIHTSLFISADYISLFTYTDLH